MDPSAGHGKRTESQAGSITGRRPRRLVAIATIAGLLGLIAVVAIWNLYLRENCDPWLGVTLDLAGQLAQSDAVVEGELTYLRSTEGGCWPPDVYAVQIDEVHFRADENLTDDPESLIQVPSLRNGETIEVYASVLPGRSALTAGSLDNGRWTMALGFRPHAADEGWPSWGLEVVAGPDAITFPLWAEGDWERMDMGPPSAESLASWMKEMRVVHEGGTPGPFETAYAVSLEPPSAAEQWLRTDPKERDLTPEDVPAEFRDEFVDVMISAELPEDLRGSEDERVVSVRSPSGVVWQASIAAGPHALPVLAMPGEAWEVVEIAGNGAEETTIGSVPEQVWRGGYAVLLSIKDRDGRLHATATPIDSTEFTARMEAAADSR